MPFQFQCPQGHLLEGEPAQAGQQCHCPMCGMLFIIPAPLAMAAPAVPAFTQYVPPEPTPAESLQPPPGPFPFHPVAGGAVHTGGIMGDPTRPADQPEILHIPCPNGHELETPVEMLDQEVLCPQCQAQFLLRRKDSVEYIKKHDDAERIRLAKLGNAWLNWAIVAVVLIGISLVGLIVASMMNR